MNEAAFPPTSKEMKEIHFIGKLGYIMMAPWVDPAHLKQPGSYRSSASICPPPPPTCHDNSLVVTSASTCPPSPPTSHDDLLVVSSASTCPPPPPTSHNYLLVVSLANFFLLST